MKRNGKLLLIFLALGFLLSCTQTPEQIAKKGRGSTVHLMIAEVDRLIPLGDVIVLRPKELGSGFFVDRDKIATNIHCVTGVTKIRAKLVGTETFYDIEGITASDPKNDLVILKVAGKGTRLPLGDSDAIQVGESIIAVGNPTGGEEGQISYGKVYNRRDSDKWLRLKLRLSPGNSGGPVLNNKGKVIGVAVQRVAVQQITNEISGDQSYAIPSNTLKALLNKSEHVESLAQWQKQAPIRAYTYRSQAETLFEYGLEANLEFCKKAIKWFDTAIELYPDFASTYNSRGGAKARLEDYKAAIEDFDKVIELYPDHFGAYYSRGGMKYRLGDYKAAIEDFDKAIQLNPDYASAYNSRGVTKAKLEDYKEAIEDYNTAIQLNPNYVLAYNNRGVAKEALGQHKGAKDDFEKAKKLAPDVE